MCLQNWQDQHVIFFFLSVHSVIYAVHHTFNQNILYLLTNEVGIKCCFQVV